MEFVIRIAINLLIWLWVFMLLIFWGLLASEKIHVKAVIENLADPVVFGLQIASIAFLFSMAGMLQGIGPLRKWLRLLGRLRDEASTVTINIGSILFSTAFWNMILNMSAHPSSTEAKTWSPAWVITTGVAAYLVSFLFNLKSGNKSMRK